MTLAFGNRKISWPREYKIKPRIDFLKVSAPKLPDGVLGKDGLRVTIGLGQNPVTSRPDQTGKLLLTIRHPSPAGIADLITFELRFSLAAEQFGVEEREIALDSRATDGDPLKLPELIEWLRFIHDPKSGIQANHRGEKERKILKGGACEPRSTIGPLYTSLREIAA